MSASGKTADAKVDDARVDDAKVADAKVADAKVADASDDPVMYLVVRKALCMSPPKMAAQCSHAVMMATLDFGRLEADADKGKPRRVFRDWLGTSYTKVVLGANEKDWAKLNDATKIDLPSYLVTDLGRSEVMPNTDTVRGFWPMRRSEAPKLLSRLQVLKIHLPESIDVIVGLFGAAFGDQLRGGLSDGYLDEALVHDIAGAIFAWREREEIRITEGILARRTARAALDTLPSKEGKG